MNGKAFASTIRAPEGPFLNGGAVESMVVDWKLLFITENDASANFCVA